MLTNTFKKFAHFENYLGVGREVSEKKTLRESPTNYLLTLFNTTLLKVLKVLTWTSLHLTGPSFYLFKISNTNFDHWHITYGQIEPFTFGHTTFTYASYQFWANLMAGEIPGRVGLQGQVQPCPASPGLGQRSRRRWTWWKHRLLSFFSYGSSSTLYHCE